MQNRVSTREDIVKHCLHVFLIDIREIDLLVADLVGEIPMEEGEAEVRVFDSARINCEELVVKRHLICLFEEIILRLISLVFSEQELLCFIDIKERSLIEVRLFLEPLLSVKFEARDLIELNHLESVHIVNDLLNSF